MEFTDSIIARRMKDINGSAIREIFHLLAKPGMISFAGGNPADTALETDVAARLAVKALEKYGTSLIQYGATEGFAPLKESAAQYFRDTAGVPATPDTLLPVQGSSQAFDLILKALIDPGDVVLVESPTFLGALQAIRTYGARIESIPTDEGGVIVDALEEQIKRYHPKMIYVIPTFQNPTGVTLAADRRRPLAQLAAKYGVLLCEDDPYRDLRYEGEPLPSIASYDTEGWVAYMGSFSKIIAPGLRVGAVIANKTLMRKLVIGKQSADVHSPMLNQAIVDGYIREDILMPHIRRILDDYRRQMNAMLDGFMYFPEGTVHTLPQGGLFVWAKLPDGMDALELFPAAVEKNVAYVPGTHFYPDLGHTNTLRLNFSKSTVEEIGRGMKILGEVLGGNGR